MLVRPGSYRIRFLSGWDSLYVDEYFDDAHTWEDADVVIVGSEAVPGIDVVLSTANSTVSVNASAPCDLVDGAWIVFTNTGPHDITVEFWEPRTSKLLNPGTTWRVPWPGSPDYLGQVRWRAYWGYREVFDEGIFLPEDVCPA